MAVSTAELRSLGAALMRAETLDDLDDEARSIAGRLVGQLRAGNGGRARAQNLSAKERSSAAKLAAKARWAEVERDQAKRKGRG